MLLLWILFGSCLLCRYKSLSLAAKISVIGSGNFGTAMARKVALNVGERQRNTEEYDKTVRMWVYEEVVNGRNLTEIINSDHINIKYLPNVILPTNIIAYSDLIDAATDADVLLLVMPHQYLPGVLSQIKGKIKKDAICVSLIKGISFKPSGPELISETIANVLETNKVGVMMGANVANDVAADHYVESTIASIDSDVIETISKLFKHETFHTQKSDDVSTVEYCGALKNVIALGAGFCDALQLGSSSKAALMRQGLQEISFFCKMFDRTGNYRLETLSLSCGIADLVATCYGGRNRKCAEEFARRVLDGGHTLDRDSDSLHELWRVIEKDILNGQKLQGVDTCQEVMTMLVEHYRKENAINGISRDVALDFPLLCRIHAIAFSGESFRTLFQWRDINN